LHALHIQGLLRVNSLHYRAAALLSASPLLAELIHAAKRVRVVPQADISQSPLQSLLRRGGHVHEHRDWMRLLR
jgi:hypothetical protein